MAARKENWIPVVAGVTGTCELPGTGDENQSQIQRNSKCLLTAELSLQSWYILLLAYIHGTELGVSKSYFHTI